MSYTRGEAAIDTCDQWQRKLADIDPSIMTMADFIELYEEMYVDLAYVNESEDFSV